MGLRPEVLFEHHQNWPVEHIWALTKDVERIFQSRDIRDQNLLSYGYQYHYKYQL